MKLIDEDGKEVVMAVGWAVLVVGALEELDYPKSSALLAAQWWVADVARMKNADVGTLEEWLLSKQTLWWECPFDMDDGGQDLEDDCYDGLFDVASQLWYQCAHTWYTRIGMLRALRKAAKEPVKTTEELARMWAAEMGLTVEE